MTHETQLWTRPAAPTPSLGLPVLGARGLSKTYGPTVALGGVDVDLLPGEAVAVMGASGSGKSTLLHSLAGVIVPDSGSVVVTDARHGSCDLVGLGAEERAAVRLRSFGFVFQQGLLLPELTAVENVALPLMLGGLGRRPAQERAVTCMAQLGLGGMEDRRLGQLSGGQQQRVAIARAQVGDPVVVFADEPTGALDSTTSSEVMDALLASTRDRGRTLVVVTHDPRVASTCDRVVHLADGLVVTGEGRGGRSRAARRLDAARSSDGGRRPSHGGQRLRDLAPLLLRGSPADRRSQALPVASFAVVTALTLTVAGGTEFFLHLDEHPGVDRSYGSTYAGLAGAALVILAVPLLSLCASAVRLSTRRRDTRLSSLRLLGASRRLLVLLSVLEAAALAALGVLLGAVGHLVLAPAVGLVPFVGGPIGAAAVVPSPGVGIATVAALVGTAVAAAVLGLRRVAITPLGVRTRQDASNAHWVRAAVAVGVVAALWVALRFAGAAGSEVVAGRPHSAGRPQGRVAPGEWSRHGVVHERRGRDRTGVHLRDGGRRRAQCRGRDAHRGPEGRGPPDDRNLLRHARRVDHGPRRSRDLRPARPLRRARPAWHPPAKCSSAPGCVWCSTLW